MLWLIIGGACIYVYFNLVNFFLFFTVLSTAPLYSRKTQYNVSGLKGL